MSLSINRPIKRRSVIQGVGATLGVLALRGFSVQAAEPAHCTHGVASGDPLSDRVILWTRVIPGSGDHPVVVSFESYNTLENSMANESTKISLKTN